MQRKMETRADILSHWLCRDHAPTIITRKRDSAVVLMSLEDYESMAETNYLMSSPKNARRLLDAIREDKAGGAKVRKLIE